MSSQEKDWGWIVVVLGVVGCVVWLFLFLGGSNSFLYFRWWGWIVWIFLIVWGLALTNIFFTFVDEGTVKIVVKGGEFVQGLIQWKGHTFAGAGQEKENQEKENQEKENQEKENQEKENQEKEKKFADYWEIIEGEEPYHPFGGLRFYGIWPIYEIYTYKLRWQDIQLVEGEEKLEFHEKVLDYVLVKPAVYGTDIKKAETGGEERIPVDIQFLVTMRVINPYKALFVAPPNFVEKILARLNALLRGWVGLKTLDQLLKLKEEGVEKIWGEFEKEPLIQEFKERYGVVIEKNGIEIRDINLPKEYQKAAALEKEEQFRARAFAAATSGTEIAMLSQWTGVPIKELQTEIQEAIKNDPENGFQNWLKKYPIIAKNWNLIQQKQLGVKPILVGSADGSPLDPLTSVLATLVSLARGGNQGGQENQLSPEEQQRIKEAGDRKAEEIYKKAIEQQKNKK